MTMTAPKKKAKAAPKVEAFNAVVSDATVKTVSVSPAKNAKPGDPDFDWQAQYPDEGVFVYTAEDGRTVGLAAMSVKRRPKPGVLRKLRHQPAIEQMWFVIERVSCEAALEVSDDFEDADYSKMFEEWSEWSNTTAGESSRSSTS